MRVHEVMRCGHVQEWPPGQRVHGRLGMPWELWVCSDVGQSQALRSVAGLEQPGLRLTSSCNCLNSGVIKKG
eukprot:scaffold21597_cov56-Phaeocystis_antarctica.AAC.2